MLELAIVNCSNKPKFYYPFKLKVSNCLNSELKPVRGRNRGGAVGGQPPPFEKNRNMKMKTLTWKNG